MTGSTNRSHRLRLAWKAALVVAACGALGGCQEGGLAGALRSAGVGGTPDEFLVLPTKPLELPDDLTRLPPPTPGATNLVDPRPREDAVAALTGRPAPAGVANAGALVVAFGPVDPQIRSKLAQEDATFRRENSGRLLERLANVSTDDVIYEDMKLDQNLEFQRLRAQGLRVPAAPPLIE